MRAGFLVAFLCVLLTAGSAAAQCRVEGSASTADGSPMVGASVLLYGPGIKTPLSTTTDANGRFVIENVKAGTRVRVTFSMQGRVLAEGYTLVSLPVEKLEVQERLRGNALGGVTADGGPSSDLGGVVRTSAGAAVAGATVSIADTGLTTRTDSVGRFLFGKLRPGLAIPLQVSAPGFETASEETVINAGGGRDTEITLKPATSASVAATPDLLDATDAAGRIVLRPDQLAKTASTYAGGLGRAMQFLPGILGTVDAPEAASIRGGTPGDTLVVFDGMTLYPPAAGITPVDIVNGSAVQTVQVARGLFGAADGGRLGGGIILNGQAPVPAGRPEASVTASLLGLEAHARTPITRHAELFVAGRHSSPSSLYGDALDWYGIKGSVSQRDRALTSTDGDLGTSPDSSFRDLNARLDVRFGSKDSLAVSFYDATRNTNLSRDIAAPLTTSFIPAEDLILPADAVIQVGDIRAWESRGVSASISHQWAPGSTTTLSFGRTKTTSDSAQASFLTSESKGGDYWKVANRAGTYAASDTDTLTDTTFRLDTTVRAGFGHQFSFGGEAKLIDGEYVLGREHFKLSRLGGLTTAVDDITGDNTDGKLYTFYLDDAWRPSAAISITPGIRVSYFDKTSETYVDPRITLSYRIVPRFRLKAGYASDHQVVGTVTQEDRMQGDRGFWAVSDGTSIPVAQVRQATFGATLTVPFFEIDAEGFYKQLDDVTMFAPRLFPGMPASFTNTLFHVGSATVTGVDVLVQHANERNRLVFGYTGSKSEYDYPTLEADTFPGTNDVLHQFRITDSVVLVKGLSFTAAWVIAAGRPYSPASSVGEVWLPYGVGVYDVTFGDKNSRRLPAYHRLDLSTQYELQWKGVKTAFGVAATNVYDRQNVMAYDFQTVGETLVANDLLLPGRAFNIFLKLGF